MVECTCNTANFVCDTSQPDSTGEDRKGHRYFFQGLNNSPIPQLTAGPQKTPENDLSVSSSRHRILLVLWDSSCCENTLDNFAVPENLQT